MLSRSGAGELSPHIGFSPTDWVIDLGPDGGDSGGRVLAEGRPEDIAKVPESYTGQFLAGKLRRPAKRKAAAAKAAE